MDSQVQSLLEEIQAQIVRKELRQADLAHYWSVTPSAASKILHGKRKITLEQVVKAADFLAMDAHELLYLAKISKHYLSQINRRRR